MPDFAELLGESVPRSESVPRGKLAARSATPFAKTFAAGNVGDLAALNETLSGASVSPAEDEARLWAEGAANGGYIWNFISGAVRASPPVQAGLAYRGETGELGGFAKLALDVAPSQSAVTRAIIAGGASAAEWSLYGRVAGPLFRIGTRIPGVVKVITAAAEEVSNIVSGDIEDVALEKLLSQTLTGPQRIAGHVTAGAGISAVGVGVQALAEHRVPTATEMETSLAVGTLFGAAAGIFGAATHAAVGRNFQRIWESLGASDKATFADFDRLAAEVAQRHQIPPSDAARQVARVVLGKGSEAAKVAVNDLIAKYPKLEPFFHNLLTMPEEKVVAETLQRLEAAPQTAAEAPPLPAPFELVPEEILRTQAREIYPQEVDIMRGPDYRNAAISGEELERLHKNSLQIGKPPLPATPPPLEAVVPAAEPLAAQSKALLGETEVRADKPTLAGTVVTTPGAKFSLPPGNNPVTDVPAIPKLRQPSAAAIAKKPSAVKIADLIDKNDWRALEAYIGKGGTTRATFNALIDMEVLRPEHVEDADTARTIAGAIRDRLPTKAGVENLSEPKNAALFERAQAFIARSFALRGEPQAFEEANRVLRELGSDFVVRQHKVSNKRTVVKDSSGRAAIVATKDAPPPHVVDLPPLPAAGTAGKTDVEQLKLLEMAMNKGEMPPSHNPPPRAGIAPPPSKLLGSIADEYAKLLETKIAVAEKRLGRVLTTDEIVGVEEGIRKQRGAVLIPRGKQITEGPLAALAKKLGGDIWTLPEGVATRIGGEERLWPSPAAAADFMRRSITELRGVAEANATLDSGRIHPNNIVDLSALLRTVNQLADIPSAATEPRLLQQFVEPGRIGREGELPLLASLVRQGRVLLRFGDAGKKVYAMLATAARALEMTVAQDSENTLQIAARIKQLGGTVRNIEDGTAPKAALDLHKRYVQPIWDRQYKDSVALGVAGPETADYGMPHYWNFEAKDVPGELLTEMREKGYATTAADAATVLNDPIAAMQAKVRGLEAKVAKQEARERLRWIHDRSVQLDRTLTTERLGNKNFIDDYLETARRGIVQRNTSLVRAYTFGPNGERLTAELDRIEDMFGRPSRLAAEQIVKDQLGHLGPAKPSALEYILTNVDRLYLSLSGTRHVPQVTFYLARFGPQRTLLGLANALGSFRSNFRLSRSIGAGLSAVRRDLLDGVYGYLRVDEKAYGNAVKLGMKYAERLGEGGSALLHGVLATVRTVGTRIGWDAFPDIYAAGLRGEKDALSVLSETFGHAVTPANLATLDKRTLQVMFAKATADFGGLTFRPVDMPQFARTPLGRFLLQFRGFMWNLTGGWLNEMFNSKFSAARRGKAALAFLVGMPTFSLLDAKLRRSLDAGTINSEEALDAVDRLWNKPGIGRAMYAEMQLLINVHGLGMIGDILQGGNLGNRELISREATMQAAGFAAPLQLAYALSRAAQGTLYGRPEDWRAAEDNVAALFGPLGLGTARKVFGKKTFRLAKRQTIRDLLDF